jgi:hypothetical protein
VVAWYIVVAIQKQPRKKTIIIMQQNLFYSECSVFFSEIYHGQRVKETKYYKMASEYFASFMSSEKDN